MHYIDLTGRIKSKRIFLTFGSLIIGYFTFILIYRQEARVITKPVISIWNEDQDHPDYSESTVHAGPYNIYTNRGLFQNLPTISLTIRAASIKRLIMLTYCVTLRSVALYWSKQIGNVAIIFDKESKDDHKWAASLAREQNAMGINFVFYYEPLPKDPSILQKVKRRKLGYNRQILSSFYMDLYIKTDVIAWIDTDGKFTVPVTPENIINARKLLVKGMNTFQYGWVREWDNQCMRMIGKPMISDFMTYFPVYIWRDTVINCRNYIIKHMNVTDMDMAFLKTGTNEPGPGGDLSPVNIIMNYAYYFERDRYDWHIDIRNSDVDGYNKLHAAPGFELTPNLLTPDVHVSLHDKYYKDDKNIVNKKSYCLAARNSSIQMSNTLKRICSVFKNSVMWELFTFCNTVEQEHVTTWCKTNTQWCLHLINNQDKRVKTLIKYGTYNLDLRRVKAVEHAAEQMGVTCPSYF